MGLKAGTSFERHQRDIVLQLWVIIVLNDGSTGTLVVKPTDFYYD